MSVDPHWRDQVWYVKLSTTVWQTHRELFTSGERRGQQRVSPEPSWTPVPVAAIGTCQLTTAYRGLLHRHIALMVCCNEGRVPLLILQVYWVITNRSTRTSLLVLTHICTEANSLNCLGLERPISMSTRKCLWILTMCGVDVIFWIVL